MQHIDLCACALNVPHKVCNASMFGMSTCVFVCVLIINNLIASVYLLIKRDLFEPHKY